MSLDPASLQILISRLEGIAEEMGLVLCRSAFSPNIKERADCSAAVFSPDGELLAQAEHIPVHLGAMPASVRAVIQMFGGGSDSPQSQLQPLKPGDQVILNDPFAGGTHINDITIVAPCFAPAAETSFSKAPGTSKRGKAGRSDQKGELRLIGWVANRAHHNDLGGAAAGSMPPEASEIFEEGLRIPPVIFSDAVKDIICANSRTPNERLGDLNAQLGANNYGVTALVELAGSTFDEVLDYGERRTRAAIAEIPDGSWEFADVVDSSGPEKSQREPAEIKVRLEISGDEIRFDFTGSSAQTPGSANAVEAVARSCVAFAVRSVIDPSIPANGGAFRPVSVAAPAASIVAAVPPSAVGAGNVEVSQRISDVCLGALAKAAPDRVGAASQGTMNNILAGGISGQATGISDGMDGWVYYETLAGGQGARPIRDGMNGVHTGMTNTKNTPIEALERTYPMRVRSLMLRQGSGGAGQYKGGEGIVRELEMLVPAKVSLICERQTSQPWGLAGGSPGAKGESWLLPAGDEGAVKKLLDKTELDLSPGDVIRILTPGGGGWGKP